MLTCHGSPWRQWTPWAQSCAVSRPAWRPALEAILQDSQTLEATRSFQVVRHWQESIVSDALRWSTINWLGIGVGIGERRRGKVVDVVCKWEAGKAGLIYDMPWLIKYKVRTRHVLLVNSIRKIVYLVSCSWLYSVFSDFSRSCGCNLVISRGQYIKSRADSWIIETARHGISYKKYQDS